MRVLVAPGPFGGELTAVQAARAIADGWARRAPDDELTLAPMSDAGLGFVDAMHASVGGELVALPIPDLYGDPAAGSVLVAGGTAYVETSGAYAPRSPSSADAERATSLGVGRLVAAACRAAVSRVVIGVGGAGAGHYANDGGAGLLAGLGARSVPPHALTGGAVGLQELTAVDLTGLADTRAGASLVLATDDDTPLLGLLGTTSTSGIGRGIAAEALAAVDGYLERLAALAGHRPALLPGAGAGGGVGYGLFVAGAARAPGLGTVAADIDLTSRMSRADLVVTGEAALDFGDGSGQPSIGVAAAASAAVRPCIAFAGQVRVGVRELRAVGIESAYGVHDAGWGSLSGRGSSSGRGDPAAELAALAERVARTWSWSR